MQMDRDLMFHSEPMRPFQKLTGNGIDGVRPDREANPFAVVIHILDQSLVMAFAFLRLFFIKTIEANAGYDTSQSHLLRHIGRDTRALIRVEESGLATLHHIQAR